MSLLLDTCTFIWLVNEPKRLSRRAEALLANSDEVYLSAVSVCELMVRITLGKLDLPGRPDLVIDDAVESMGLQSLPFTIDAAVLLSKLPRLHPDPFDRMLLCQALRHNLTIVTPDTLLEQYPIKTIW